MKFKAFFQRRSATSMAESDSMSATTTTKRKKKDAKPLTTTMKSAAAGTKNAFIMARQEKCASCSASSSSTPSEAQSANIVAQHTHQPQPDEFADSIRYNCENCGGCDRQKSCENEEETTKLKEKSPLNGDMDLGKVKEESNEYEDLLLKAHARIKELSDEVEKMKLENAEKSKEFADLHDDFLLCIRGAERFRVEAELKAAKLETEVSMLREELSELRNKGRDIRETCTDYSASTRFSEPQLAAASETVQNSGDCEATEVKKISEALSDDDSPSPGKVDGAFVFNDQRPIAKSGDDKRREEKLGILRKNCRGSVRNGLLKWCQAQTEAYQNVEITNFSTSWSNGLALAALVHSLNPDLFDYNALVPSRPVDNFETALKAAVKLGVASRLNAIKLIVESENPPWEPIVAYVTEVYLVAPV